MKKYSVPAVIDVWINVNAEDEEQARDIAESMTFNLVDKNTENKKYEISFCDYAEAVGKAIDIEEEEKSLPKPQSIKDVFIND